MDGLFRILHQEMGLAEKPNLLGAPEGYAAYPMARFDEQSGRLIENSAPCGHLKYDRHPCPRISAVVTAANP